MSRGLLFWLLMVLWLVLSVYWYWPAAGVAGAGYLVLGLPVLIFLLLGLLGWQVFGPPVKG